QQCPNLTLTFARLIPHSANRAVLADQIADVGAHFQSELRVSRRLRGEKLQELRLRNHQYVRELALESSQVERLEEPLRCHEAGTVTLGVWNFVHLLSQSELIENLQRRRVDRVAAKLPIKIPVHLKQRHRDAAACKQESQH